MTVGNRHDAEDLTTQTFLRMLESIGKFRFQSAPFSAWLFRIAHNLSMDHFRANRRWQPGGGGARAARLRRSAPPRTRRSSRSDASRCSS